MKKNLWVGKTAKGWSLSAYTHLRMQGYALSGVENKRYLSTHSAVSVENVVKQSFYHDFLLIMKVSYFTFIRDPFDNLENAQGA